MTGAGRGRDSEPALRRPAAGAAIDPERMIRMRDWRALTRIELAEKITDRSRFAVAKVLGIRPGVLRPLYPGAGIPRAVLARELAVAQLSMAELEARLPLDVLPEGLGRDSVTKFENGARHPKARTLRAICTALECDPPYLFEDGPEFAAMPLEDTATIARRLTAERNQAMRDFGDEHGISYRNAAGRIRYTRELTEAYEQYLDGRDLDPRETPALAS